jgi:hypothetical protein
MAEIAFAPVHPLPTQKRDNAVPAPKRDKTTAERQRRYRDRKKEPVTAVTPPPVTPTVPGAPSTVVAMAVAMESAKLVTAGWLAARWRVTPWVARLTLVTLVAGLAIINAAGVFSQFVAAHVGSRGEAASALQVHDADLAARIDASVAAKGRQMESESAPIRYVAELLGSDTDSERAIRWLILMMVICCDPLAIALTAAASAGRERP